jgi:hypothetical protein
VMLVGIHSVLIRVVISHWGAFCCAVVIIVARSNT